MKYISDQLEKIAAELGATYCRANSLEEANLLQHYKKVPGLLMVYTGFGAQNSYFEGIEPLVAVEAELYILKLLPVKDYLAETKDTILQETAQAGASVVFNFPTLRRIEAYDMEPVTVYDDLWAGQILQFAPILEGDAACKLEPLKGGIFNFILDSLSSAILIDATNSLDFSVGDKIRVKSDDNLYDESGIITTITAPSIFTDIPYKGNAGAGTYTEDRSP